MTALDPFLLDDFTDPARSRFGTAWICFSDEVMDGPSVGSLAIETRDGQPCLSLRGEVRIEKGFVQAALPLVHSRRLFDARAYAGVEIDCRSPEAEGYWLHLRTRELSMPWQHYRAPLAPGPEWQTLRVPFVDFAPMSTSHSLNLELLSRIGVVAGKRCFSPDIQVRSLSFYPL